MENRNFNVIKNIIILIFVRRFYITLPKGCLNCTDPVRDKCLAKSEKEFLISDETAESIKGEQLLKSIFRTLKTAFCILLNGGYPCQPKTCTYHLLKTLLLWTRLICTWTKIFFSFFL